MQINKEILERVAKVAKLDLTSEEKKEFLPQMEEILEYFKLMDEADADNELKVHPVEIGENMREDIVKKSLPREKILGLSKNTKDEYFKGPKVVD